MLNIEITDNTIKSIMAIVVIAVVAVSIFLLAPNAYKVEVQASDNVAAEHKAWLAANTNHDADKDVYY